MKPRRTACVATTHTYLFLSLCVCVWGRPPRPTSSPGADCCCSCCCYWSLRFADTDHGGWIIHADLKKARSSVEDADLPFGSMDRNNDGLLSLVEIYYAVQSYSEKVQVEWQLDDIKKPSRVSMRTATASGP